MPQIEEFDDDTDLPLPPPPPQPSSSSSSSFRPQQQQREHHTQDATPYKNWTVIYPLYLDAKRPFRTGARRLPRAKSLWWPQSTDLARAAERLRLPAAHEVDKTHPGDWENPGRVRVKWRDENGGLLNGSIKNKRLLLEAIGFMVQTMRPELIPREPYYYTIPPYPSSTPIPAPPPAITAKGAKAPKQLTAKENAPAAPKERKSALPQPPAPIPAPSARLPAHSPALEAGMLVETVKAGLAAQAKEAANAPPAPTTPGAQAAAGAKGKRKVMRVRQ